MIEMPEDIIEGEKKRREEAWKKLVCLNLTDVDLYLISKTDVGGCKELADKEYEKRHEGKKMPDKM